MSSSVLVTGANRVISGVRSEQHPTVDEIRKLPVAEGSRHIVMKIDSDCPDDAKIAVEKLQSQFGITKLDTVIANAGIGKVWEVTAKTTIRDVEEHLRTNTIGPFSLYLATRSLLLVSYMPRFVVISTELGSIGMQGERKIPDVAYGMSKAAVNFFVSKVHHEEPGIISFPIIPGWVRTDLGNAIASAIGMARTSITEEVSAAAVFELIEKSTKEETSGHFLNHKGVELAW